MSEKQYIIFVEGNIGSGKTTFLKRIPKFLNNCQIILEPLNIWQNLTDSDGKNILEHFYSDMNTHSYAFQSFAFLSRTQTHQKIDKSKKYIFIERSIYSDKEVFAKNCYETGIMPEIHYNLYNEWFKWMEDILKLKNTFHIYLRCQPEISFSRQKQRNRDEEKGLSLEYLKSIHNRHEEWLVDNTQCITLDSSKSFHTNDEDMNNILDELFEKIKNIDI